MGDDMRHHVPFFKSPFLIDRDEAYEAEIQENGKDERDDGRITQESSHQSSAKELRMMGLLPIDHTKAHDAELFYDLFFVANLTVFTFTNEVNDSATLRQRAGFFCLLWFTWYNVALHDIRFSVDSVFERIAKALQYLVMIGLAATGPKFNPGEEGKGEAPHLTFFRAITLCLMVSRLVFVFQYLHVLYHARHFKNAIVPFALTIATYLTAAMIYLGLYFSFLRVDSDGGNRSYIAWYVVGVLESMAASGIASFSKAMSFKGTYLVERMSQLTLIILGEGVIAVSRSTAIVIPSDGVFPISGPTIANIICATLILYFIYLVYFDWIRKEHFGRYRQQVWSFLHFPLHLALVLAVEGIALSINWCAAVTRASDLTKEFETASTELFDSSAHPEAVDFERVAEQLNTTSEEIIVKRLEESISIEATLSAFSDLITSQYAAASTIANGTENREAAENAFWWLWGVTYESIFEIVGFEEPTAESSGEVQTSDVIENILNPFNFSQPRPYHEQTEEAMNVSFSIYRETYIYFFVTTGLVIMISAALGSLSTVQKSLAHRIRLAISGLMGLALCLLALISTDNKTLRSFVTSHYVLPTMTILLFVVVLINGIKPTAPRLSLSRLSTKSATP